MAAILMLQDRGAEIPTVPAGKLDPSAAALLERRREAVRASPGAALAWGEYGAALGAYDFHDAARAAFAQAERLAPAEARWPYLHGLLIATEDPPEAIKKLREAVRRCGNEPSAPRLRLARLLAEDAQWDEARRHLDELLRAQPENAHALLALAQVAQARGDWAEALSLVRRCAMDARTGRAAWSLIATTQRRLNDTASAEEAARKAAAMPPGEDPPDIFAGGSAAKRSDPRALVEQAQKHLVARQIKEAAPLIARLNSEHPSIPESLLLAGRLELLRKNLRGAEDAFRTHLSGYPQSENGHFQLGLVLLAQSRHADALAAFKEATALKPNFGGAFFNTGVALLRLKREHEAVPALREAIRHNPENIDSHLLLAEVLTRIGEGEAADGVLRQARAINPRHPGLKAGSQRRP